MSFTAQQTSSGDTVKEEKIGGACNTYKASGGKKKLENVEHMDDLDADG